MGRDHGSQAEKACIGWNHVWMEETDTQGCKLGDWAERADSTTYRCKWCTVLYSAVQCTLPCPAQVRRDKHLFPDTKILFFFQISLILHQWWKYLKHLA